MIHTDVFSAKPVEQRVNCLIVWPEYKLYSSTNIFTHRVHLKSILNST